MPEIVAGNAQNDTPVNEHLTHSNFNLSRLILGTERFGEISPVFALRVFPGDKRIQYKPKFDLRSYTLKSPLMQEIKKLNTYGFVARQALLPFNWEKLEKNPKFGSDVDASVVGTSVVNFRYKISTYLKFLIDDVTNSGDAAANGDMSIANFFNHLFFDIINLESWLSNGSLLASMNCHLSKFFDCDGVDFDTIFDKIVDLFFKLLNDRGISTFGFFVNGEGYNFSFTEPIQSTTRVVTNIHEFLDIIRDNGGVINFIESYFEDLEVDDLDVFSDIYSSSIMTFQDDDEIAVDIGFFWSYQILCAHYFTNDDVDNIYNAELFREYIGSLLNIYDIAGAKFSWNGLNCYYDYLSAYYFDKVLEYVSTCLNDDGIFEEFDFAYYFTALTRFNRSLRYEDYFVGSRKRALAVGDVQVDTSGSSVSVIDIAKSTMAAKFLQATNRATNGIKGYYNAIFHANPKHDMHDPMWLANTADGVYTPEVENTGAAQLEKQNSVTSIFRAKDSRFAFEFSSDLPGYLIGVEYFDINRVYKDGIEACFYPVDRFDLFNPMMQYIGDQAIYQTELNSICDKLEFGYTARYEEYKQLPNYAFGGFLNDYIQGFAYLYEPIINGQDQISSNFIRNKNFELDRFYTSLSGKSLGHYFHFIILRDNELHANRPMAVSPGILK